EKKYKKKNIKKIADLFIPVYLFEIFVDMRIIFTVSNKTGEWAYDVINDDFLILPEGLTFHYKSMEEGLIVHTDVSPKEAEGFAKEAVLEKKYKYLKKPKNLKINFLETIYDPYYLVMYEKGNKEKVEVINAISGESNLILRERLLTFSY